MISERRCAAKKVRETVMQFFHILNRIPACGVAKCRISLLPGFIELPKRKFDQSRECTFSRPFQIRLQCPALGRARKSVRAFRYRSKNLPLFRWQTLETELDWLALGSLEVSFCSLGIRLSNLTGMSNIFPVWPSGHTPDNVWGYSNHLFVFGGN